MNNENDKRYVPLTMPSSTKTMVGLSPEEEAELAEPVAPRRAQRTLLGAGPEHERAVEAYLAVARERPAPPARAGRTLVGLAPDEAEPPPPASVAPLSLGPTSLGPTSLPATELSAPTIADLPFQRPMVAAAGVAAAVAVWALMMLFLFSL